MKLVSAFKSRSFDFILSAQKGKLDKRSAKKITERYFNLSTVLFYLARLMFPRYPCSKGFRHYKRIPYSINQKLNYL